MNSNLSLPLPKEKLLFRKVDLLKKKELAEGFFERRTYQLSSYSFVNLFAWKDFFDFEFEMIDGNLCIFARSETGCFLYLPPLGEEISKTAIDASFDAMHFDNQGSGVSRIENVEENQLRFFDPKEFSFFKKCDEYVYNRQEIAALRGNKFKPQRALCNYFIKHYAYEFLPFQETILSDCELLFDRWAKEREKINSDVVYVEMLEENRSVHRLALKHYRQLGLIGRVVYIEGKIAAYTFGYPLNDKIFCVLFEIADLKMKGLSTFLFSRFCADTMLKNFEFINVMDDFGLENVKKTKLSFHPCQIIPSFVVTRKSL